jgi:hypothetical protein
MSCDNWWHKPSPMQPKWEPPAPTPVTPNHYRQHPSGVEAIQITEHFSFNLGNVIKYVWRADLKNGLEDLEKARWYLDREIERRRRADGHS